MLFLHDSCIIKTPVRARDADGIRKNNAFTTVTVKCRFTDSVNDRLAYLMKQKDENADIRLLYLDKNTVISLQDFVEFDSQTYRVQNIYKPRSFSQIHHLKVYLQAIEKWNLW